MPKQLQEIKNFTGGINSNASPTDISPEAATYSLNINSNSIQGRLEGIRKDSVLTETGFRRIINTSANKITLDYSTVFGDYGGGIPAANTSLEGSMVTWMHRFDGNTYDSDSVSNTLGLLNNTSFYGWTSIDAATSEVAPASGFGFVFDDQGTLTRLKLDSIGSNVNSSYQKIDIEYPNYRYNDSKMTQAQKVFGYNSAQSQPINDILWPNDNIVQISIASKEFIFLLNDTDFSSSNAVPYGPFNNLDSLAIPMLNGTHYGSSGWNPIIEVVDVNLNANRVNADEGNAVDTFLTAIKTKLEEYSDLCSVSIENRQLQITPLKDGFHTARITSIDNTNAIRGPQVILTMPSAVLPFLGQYFTTINNKMKIGQTDLISFSMENNHKFIEYLGDIFGANPSKRTLLNSIKAIDVDLVKDDEKVYFGFGGSKNTPPKVGMSLSSSEISASTVSDSFEIENFTLESFDAASAAFGLGESVIPQMYGTEASDTNKEIMYDDIGSDELGYMDYDYTVGNIPGGGTVHLHTYLQALNDNTGPKVGQVFCLLDPDDSSFIDSTDSGFLRWKRFDYDFSSDLAEHDLFMYCGLSEDFSETTTPRQYPILRYIGNLLTQGGTPAFAYSLQNSGMSISKVSLTTSNDNDAFPGTALDGLYDTSGSTVNDIISLTNTGSRIQMIDLQSKLEGATAEDVISSMSPCTGPFLYNNIGLPGANSPFTQESSDAFCNHGGLKYIARHGVFWVALSSKVNSLYRVNLIDAYELTEDGLRSELISLSSEMIPTKLCNSHTDNELSSSNNGIINVTIPDQEWHNQETIQHNFGIGEISSAEHATGVADIGLGDGFESPLAHNWTNLPEDAKIIGICETFECGRITNLITSPVISNYNAGDAFEFHIAPCDMSIHDPENYSGRLTTGDTIMFSGLNASDSSTGDIDAHKKFNIPASGPYQVNMVDTNKIIVRNANNGIPALRTGNTGNTAAENKTFWYNSKVWIIYGLKDPNSSFNKWDLFLYNANTLDMEGKVLKLADRTPPYNEVGYYMANDWNGSGALENQKVYYPRQFSFLMNHFYPNCGRGAFFTNTGSFASLEDGTIESAFDDDGLNFWEGDVIGDNGDLDDELVDEYSEEYGVKWNRKNFLPNGMTLPFMITTHLPQNPFANTFGIYDKSGRWSLNGGKVTVDRDYNIYKNGIASFPYGQCVPMRSGNDSIDDAYGNININDASLGDGNVPGGQGAPAANGKLFWGDNLGWICDESRSIKPIKNSLHPLVHYSRGYLSGRTYQGTNQTDSTQNLPRHAVSFMGHLTGHFLDKHATYERCNLNPLNLTLATIRQSIWLLIYGEDWNDIHQFLTENQAQASVGDFGVVFSGDNLQPLKTFIPDNEDSQTANPDGSSGYSQNSKNYNELYGDLGAEKISEYDETLTLFQVDEWTGHPGIVYRNVIEGSTPSQTDFGVVRGRPNFGGPEIENPNYKPWVEHGHNASATDEHYAYNHDERIVGMMHSSVNLGYVDNDDNHDQGWTGYKPPHLFQPGKGYYVFINRTWKNNSYRTIHNSKEHLTNEDNVWENSGWNFQWFTWPSDKPSSRAGIDENSNRWHNFSSVAVADSIDSGRGSGKLSEAFNNRYVTSKTPSASGPSSGTPWVHNKYTARKLMYNENMGDGDTIEVPINQGEPGENAVDNVFKTGRFHNQGPVMTFHEIDIDGLGDINSVFPTVLRTKQSASENTYQDNIYIPAYVCGTGLTDNENNSGLAVICSNMHHRIEKESDYIYNKSGTGVTGGYNSHRQYRNWRDIGGNVSDNANWYTNYHNRSTCGLEKFRITNRITLTMANTMFESTVGDFWLGSSARESSFQPYQSSFIGNNLIAFDTKPGVPLTETSTPTDGSVSTGTDSLDLWLSFNDTDNEKNYIAQKDNIFDVDGVNQNIYIDGVQIVSGSFDRKATDNDVGGNFTNTLIGSSTDGDILYDSTSAVVITPKEIVTQADITTSPPGIQEAYGIENNVYKYKIALEHDNQYDSELHVSAYSVNTGTYDSNNPTGLWEYNEIALSISESYINQLSKRVTGINIYRAIGELSTDYALIKSIPFKMKNWTYIGSELAWTHTFRDQGASLGSYETINGIHPALHHTSIHYGLSTTYKGYMYITRAWHPEMENIERYIFRSLPGNFFVYNWIDEWCILPEKPLAMTSFQSRLYVWGKNKLYKIDPINLVIEDEFEGVSIASRNSFIKTEYGLCFLDKNNIYLHDGNQPNPIGGPILKSGAHAIKQSLDTSDRLQSGYKELISQTLENGDAPNVFFLSSESSFAILLSNKDKEGRLFTYNILNKRWDFIESPRPVAVSSSNSGTVLIGDGELLWNFVNTPDKEYYTYARREFDWHSKELNLGTDTQDKVFRGINLSGTASYYCTDSDNNELEISNINMKTSSIKAYIDNNQVPLTLQRKMYNSTRLGNTSLQTHTESPFIPTLIEGNNIIKFTLSEDTNIENILHPDGVTSIVGTGQASTYNSTLGWLGSLQVLVSGTTYTIVYSGNNIDTDVYGLQPYDEGVFDDYIYIETDDSVNKRQEFIRPGHYIRIDDEIMWVSAVDVSSTVVKLNVTRGRLGTDMVSHVAPTPVNIIAPRLKLASGSKGKRLKIVLEGQRGYVDSIGLIYKAKGVK